MCGIFFLSDSILYLLIYFDGEKYFWLANDGKKAPHTLSIKLSNEPVMFSKEFSKLLMSAEIDDILALERHKSLLKRYYDAMQSM